MVQIILQIQTQDKLPLSSFIQPGLWRKGDIFLEVDMAKFVRIYGKINGHGCSGHNRSGIDDISHAIDNVLAQPFSEIDLVSKQGPDNAMYCHLFCV